MKIEPFLNRILLGDCKKIMFFLPSESVDCVVTDPPYGISFMGKDWDKALPEREAFEQVFRVLKSGGLAFVMSSPRQDVLWRMSKMLEDVGFELKQSFVAWIYKSGFPKAYDVSKGIDKNILKAKFFRIIRSYLCYWFQKSGFKINEINEKMGYSTVGSGMAGHWFANITQQTLPTKDQWFRLKKILEFDDQFDAIYSELRDGKERPKTGKGMNPISWGEENKIHRGGFSKEYDLTTSASDLAKKWEGWKSTTGLKPALECILMVNKPLSERTIVDNVLKYGTGAINVDATRIPTTENLGGGAYAKNPKGRSEGKIWKEKSGFKEGGAGEFIQPLGRFPANLLVSAQALSCFKYFDLDAWAKHHGFLDVTKASKKERNRGLELLPTRKHLQGLDTRGRVLIRKNGSKTLVERWQAQGKNVHPTVKPVELMTYLIELGCPKEGVVLDPYVGSGTTCLAAKKLGRKYIGIEVNPEYVEIAKARLRAT